PIANCSLIINGKVNLTNQSITKNINQSFVVNDLSAGRYNWSISCTDNTTLVGSSDTYEFAVILTTGFDGRTTDFASVDVSNISNLILENVDYGIINYSEAVDLSNGTNLSSIVNITYNKIGVGSLSLPELNKSAVLSLYNLAFNQNPIILRNDELCPETICKFISYDGNLTFNVSYFTAYSGGENSNLTIWDDTDNSIKYTNQQIKFYANYTNRTSGSSINGSGVYCNISFNITPNGPFDMAFNTTTLLYGYNRSFTNHGVFSWNVSCNGSSLGYETLTAVDDVNVTQDLVYPSVVLVSPANKSWYNNDSVVFSYNATDNAGIANCSLIINNKINATNSSISNNITNNITSVLDNDIYNWSINCTDVNGFTNNSETRLLYVDYIQPEINLLKPGDNTTVGKNVVFNFTATDNMAVNLTCNLTINGSVNMSNINASNGTVTTIIVNNFNDGTYYWNVSCWDNATNVNTSLTWNFSVSGAAPLIENVSVIPNITGYGQNVLITVNVTDTDEIDYVKTNISYQDGSVHLFNMVNSSTIYQYIFNDSWRLGTYNITVIAVDKFGNENVSSVYKLNISANASISVKTEKDSYGANKYVKLTGKFDIGDGSDGILTVTSVNTIINNYTYFSGNESAGNLSIVVNDGSAFSNDNEILIIQMQNGTGLGQAGNYEFRKIVSGGGTNTLTLDSGLENTYGSGIFNTDPASATQVVKVPQYTNITINSGASITAPAWTGYIGGIIIFRATGTVTVNGAINVSEKGYRGGYYGISNNCDGAQGESWTGKDTSNTCYAYGAKKLPNEGGGGSYICGGGGEYGGSATDSDDWNGPGGDEYARKGEIYGTEDLSKIFFGSGGGGMWDGNDPGISDGGDGGGIIIVYANNITATTNSFLSNGQTTHGQQQGSYTYGSSGGAGGSIYLNAYSIQAATNFSKADKGLGNHEPTRAGGDGGVGRVLLDYNTLSGSTYPSYYKGEPDTNRLDTLLNNIGSTNISGYLLMKVQRNITGSWDDVNIIINDTNTSNIRTINSSDYLDIAEIWNENPWDTDSSQSGYYRAYVSLTSPNGTILENGISGYINDIYTFYVDINPPQWHFMGANNTNPRVSDDVSFYANWTDASLASWEFYWNASGSFLLNGSGSFSGTYNWSNISRIIPSEAEIKTIGYYFKAYDTQDTYANTNISNITVQDVTGPIITDENVTPSSIVYSELVNITANITDNIAVDSAWVTIDLPNGTIINRNMSNSSSLYNLTYYNYLVGKYNATIYANDTNSNIGNSSIVYWNVSGFSNISWISPVDGNHLVYTSLPLSCLVSDVNISKGINNYPVKFYADGVYIGSNTSNSSGYTVFVWNVTGVGQTILNCSISDNASLLYNVTVANANMTINILVPNVTLFKVEHENNISYSLNEYEAYDTIDFVNITVNNTGGANTSNANITLNVLDPNNNVVSWFNEETKDCGIINVGDLCEKQFDNNSAGYNITSISSGTYKWNITIDWQGGGLPPNNEIRNFSVYYMPDNFSGGLVNDELTPGGRTNYVFSISNPWSKNLTLFNVTINCPDVVGLNCSCNTTGLNYCYIGDVENFSFVSFNISTNESTPVADYDINATISYRNPGLENHKWLEVENDILQVKPLLSYIVDYPDNITRSETTFNLTSYAKNIGDNNLEDVWLNWSLPSYWNNISGNLSVFKAVLAPNTTFWNNITVDTTINASLGLIPVVVKADSPNATLDTDTKNVMVLADTAVVNITVNNTNPYRGEYITIAARLLYDNNSGVPNASLLFQNVVSNVTNSSGYATVIYQIPASAPLGNFTINASHLGNYILTFTNPSLNSTNITVMDKIEISTSTLEETAGFGFDMTIIANVSCKIAIDKVTANITYPDGTKEKINLSHTTGNEYRGNFSSTWLNGRYNFTVWANNTAGYFNESSVDYFFVKGNASFVLRTDKDFYAPNEDVGLASTQSSWWNKSWSNRQEINISNTAGNLTDYQIRLIINSPDVGSNFNWTSDENATRFVWYNTSSGENIKLPYWTEKWDSASKNATIWVKVPFIENNTNTGIYFYYGNSSIKSESNGTAVFEFFDDFETFDTSRWTKTGTASVSDSELLVNTGSVYTTSTILNSPINMLAEARVRWISSSGTYSGLMISDDYSTEGSNTGADALAYYMTESSSMLMSWWAADGTTTGYNLGNGDTWTASLNTNYTIGEVVTPSNIKFYKDYNLDITSNPGTWNAPFYLWLGAFQGAASGTSDVKDMKVNWVLIRKYASTEPIYGFGEEENQIGSIINNIGSTNISGYLIMKVQTNTSGSWQDVTTIVNDTSTSKRRYVNA
ncbi:hypothetical protein COS79_03645, partial [Candidatus Woesearchaeota archaeon CG06_land_8_20_14_3_00_33_13]